MDAVHRLMEEGIGKGIFPGAVLLAAEEAEIRFFRACGITDQRTQKPVTRETIYDLASLTKPLATTLAVLRLLEQKKLSLDLFIGNLLPELKDSPLQEITIRHLLLHRSGLIDYRPYFIPLSEAPFKSRKKMVHGFLAREPLIHKPGARTLYSDVGFLLLQWIVEECSGTRLDRFVQETIYEPLGLAKLFFVDLHRNPRLQPGMGEIAATEYCPWRKRMIKGTVHDENADILGGIAGHAGLFGDAADIHRLLLALLRAYDGLESVFHPKTVQTFLGLRTDSKRRLGFDAPSFGGSSSGDCFSQNSAGHLGFTGTSFWMDLDKKRIIILLTNRVHPCRTNMGIRRFRPRLHDLVMESWMKRVA